MAQSSGRRCARIGRMGRNPPWPWQSGARFGPLCVVRDTFPGGQTGACLLYWQGLRKGQLADLSGGREHGATICLGRWGEQRAPTPHPAASGETAGGEILGGTADRGAAGSGTDARGADPRRPRWPGSAAEPAGGIRAGPTRADSRARSVGTTGSAVAHPGPSAGVSTLAADGNSGPGAALAGVAAASDPGRAAAADRCTARCGTGVAPGRCPIASSPRSAAGRAADRAAGTSGRTRTGEAAVGPLADSDDRAGGASGSTRAGREIGISSPAAGAAAGGRS